ncbi:MAG: S41 family peptidase [Pseudobdellovibrio sp.]
MGFLLGMVLAGVGGLSAETLFSPFSNSESDQKIEKFWSDTGLGIADVEALVSNASCESSKSYYRACISAISQQLLKDKSIAGDIDNSDENLTEKQIVNALLAKSLNIDFNQRIRDIFFQEKPEQHGLVAGKIINGFMSAYLDPHTYIMPTDYYNQVGSKIERSKYFVGFAFEKKDGNYFVLKVAKNSDADFAGLKISDQIKSINGQELKNLNYSQVSVILKNESVKKFNFDLVRNDQEMNLEIKRSYRFLSHIQFNKIEGEKNLGLITISKFNKGACQEVSNILHKNSQLEGLVLDLRDNPGGQLDETSCIEGLFLGKDKKAYYVDYFDQAKANEVVLTSEDQVYKGPLIVLINNQSASAAETLSGALKDYHRALIVGRRSFGKGTFQEPEVWPTNKKISLFKTQGFYLLPSRNPTQLTGVQPDIEMKATSVEKREENIFFRPIAHVQEKYPQLKSNELVKNDIYKKCINGVNSGSNAVEDLYLQKSKNILDCSIETKSRLAQAGKAVLN